MSSHEIEQPDKQPTQKQKSYKRVELAYAIMSNLMNHKAEPSSNTKKDNGDMDKQ